MLTYETVLAALADTTRRAIFERLRDESCSVGELAAQLPVTQPAVSQHLKILRQAGLVQCEPDGTRRIYRVSDKGLAALRAYIDSYWSGVLEAFGDSASKTKVRRRHGRRTADG